MSESVLESRLQTLEQEVRVIKDRLNRLAAPPVNVDLRWKQTVGMFRGDPYFKEVLEEGKAIREAEDQP